MGLMEPDGTVLKVNDAAAEFADADRDELVGRPFWEAPWWGGDEETRVGLKDAIGWAAAGEFVRYEVTAEDPETGETVAVDFSITPVTDETGSVVLLVPEGRDISERRRREQDLRHERERLEFVNRILRHNLLNGLNVVSARADILADFVDDAGQTHLDVVANRVDEMVELVETIRSFTNAIGHRRSALEPVALGPTLTLELERLAATHEDAVVSVDGSLPDVEVLADELLGDVFENVLTNAVQHNDAAVPHVTVSAEQEGETVTVEIADNGPGITDSEKTRIVDKSIEELSTPGSGFGLYLVKELVDSYGGSLHVEDNDPRGAVFTITLETS
jgi:PAS domain S-box-containing protein